MQALKKRIHTKVIVEMVPVLLFFFMGQTTFLDHMLKAYFTESEIYDIKIIFNYLSTIYTFLIIGVGMNSLLNENQYYRESMKYLFDRHKEDFFNIIGNQEAEGLIHQAPKNIQIRIWVKPKLLNRIITSIRSRRRYKYLIIRNYESLGLHGKTDDLKFEVSPKPQGIVGKCFNSKKVEYSWDLKEENQKVRYNMTQEQDEQTSDLRFCLCYPIKEDGRVISVISFDSTEPMRVGNNIKDKDLADLFVGFSVDLYKSSSHLFK